MATARVDHIDEKGKVPAMLGWSKRTEWLIVGATGAACAAGLAVGLVTLSPGALPAHTLATTPLAAASSVTASSVTPTTSKTTSHATTRRTTKATSAAKPRATRTAVGAITPGAIVSTTAPPTTLPVSTVPPSTRTSIGAPAGVTTTTTTSPPTTQPATPPAILQPSTAAVDQAITGLGAYVKSPIKPSVAQVNTLAGDVCTAFSQGSTVSQIEAAMDQRLGSIPFTTVLPGASTYIVDTAVSLYCPRYSSQLS